VYRCSFGAQRVLRRLRASRRLLFAVSAALLACGAVAVGSTLAAFSTETENRTATFAAGWIGPASALTVAPSGYDAQLAWTPGTHGPVTGEQLTLADNGASPSCPASGYSAVATMASASTSSYTALNPAATTLAGDVQAPNLLNANIDDTVTSFAVKNNATFAFSASFTIQIDAEQMLVTNEAGAGNKTWTVTRGVNGTTAAPHSGNATVSQVSVSVSSASGFPSSGSYTIQVDSEQMTVTGGQGTTTWLVTPGANGTTATSHASGAMVSQTPDPVDGHYYCYRMVSTSASSWTATASFPATQMGLVATSVTINNVSSGLLKKNDTIVVTYNQQPTLSATGLTNGVCESWDASGNVTLYIDYSVCANPPTTPSYELEITGLTNTKTAVGHGTATLGTVTVSASAPWTVTYTLSANLAQAMNPGTGAAVPDGTGTHVISAGGADPAPACTSATYACTPAATLG
jgi:hypothetical protein